MVESFKRYYHNSFLDSQRQEAYNLFLGNYIFTQGQPMLWDLATDYYLHHADPRTWANQNRKNYIDWFNAASLERRSLPESKAVQTRSPAEEVSKHDDYWLEYYKPLALSSFVKIFSFRMNSNARYVPDRSSHASNHNLSPFHPRKSSTDLESSEKKHSRKGVKIVDPYSDDASNAADVQSNRQSPPPNDSQTKHGILRDPHFETEMPPQETPQMSTFVPADKSLMNQWTLNQFYDNSLNPSVTAAEADEYKRYIDHPLNLPLVVSTEVPEDNVNLDFVEYLSTVSGDAVEDIGGGRKGFDVSEEDVADYADFLTVAENPLTVNEEDGGKKRYKAYRQWLRGKSLFKQSKVDPEYKT